MNIVFRSLFGRQWEGGARWLTNTVLSLGLLKTPPTCIILRVAGENIPDEVLQSSHVKLASTDIQLESRILQLGRRVHRRVLRKPWEQRALSVLDAREKVDLWVGGFGFEGLGAHRPLLVYYPDFQFRRFPDFFSRTEIADRERQWDYLLKRADGIVFISQATAADAGVQVTGAHDSRRFFVCGDRPFIHASELELCPDEVRRKYQLPERFKLVSNQFWVHKNHSLVLRALSEIRRSGKQVPVVAFTGHPYDYRHPDAFNSLLNLIQTEDIHNYCRLLGVIPRAEQLALIRASEAVIQPSHFEGRGNISEEVCLFGTQLLCSDLPVHRELSLPGALFFAADDVQELASLLQQNYSRSTKSAPAILEESERMARDYGEHFIAICKTVVKTHRTQQN